LVAAHLLGRRSLGIDISKQAIALARARLAQPVKTESALLERGRETYRQVNGAALAQLGDLELVPVQRNQGMDAILRQQYLGRPVALRVQRPGESVERAAALLERAGRSKRCERTILVITEPAPRSPSDYSLPPNMIAVDSPGRQIERALTLPGALPSEGA
jgi:site-specific DNA-methyltransferase (adenine-specific)